MNRLGVAPRVDNFGSLATTMWLSTVGERLNTYSSASDPVASEVPEGQWIIHYNTATTTLTAWTKISGVLYSISGGGGGGGTASYFRAYRATNQSIASNTLVKVSVDTENFDVGGYFDTSTGKYTPPAGAYLLTWQACVSNNGSGNGVGTSLYKNGSIYSDGAFSTPPGAATARVGGATVVEANGTDYFELYAVGNGGTVTVLGGSDQTFISGHSIT